MSVLLADNDRAFELFNNIFEEFTKDHIEKCAVIVVQHVVPNTIPFFKFLNSKFNFKALVPKPNSIDGSTLDFLSQMEDKIPIMHATRSQINDERFLKEQFLNSVADDEYLIILDVGGYFSQSIEDIHNHLGDRFLGIIEDTENGHQKYQSIVDKMLVHKKKSPVPILSVARSPLKEPEDFLVGKSIVYSTERVLRENNALLTNKQALVIGYGKIGKSICQSLTARNISVWVYDHDPIRSAQAFSHGYRTPTREEGILKADLIIGASGNKSLSYKDIKQLKPYCFVSSVTSADDEFDFGELRKKHNVRDNKTGLELVYINGKVVHLLNYGNAINFLHNNVLGSFIYLVASELIAATCKLYSSPTSLHNDRINSLNTAERQTVASKWQGVFVYE